MNGLVDYGIINPALGGSLGAGYNESVDRRNALAQQDRANKLADLQYQSAVDQVNRQRALQSYQANKDPNAPDYYSGLRMIDPTLAMNEEAKRSEISKTQAETATKQADLQHKKLDWAWQGIGSASTPDRAIAHITQGVKDGTLTMQEGSAEIAKLQNIAPQDFAQYRLGALMHTLAGKDALEAQAPKIDWRVAGGQSVPIQNNPLQPGYGGQAPGVAPIVHTPTVGERTAQGHLLLSQSQEQWKRDHPGYNLQSTDAGLVAVNNDNPKDVQPITLGGTPVGGKAPPVEFLKTDTQLANLAGSLKAFKDEVAKNKLTGAKGLFTGEDTANMTTKYTSVLMGMKDLYTLGALTGPDMSIIESQLQNPASWAASMTSKKAFEAQIKTIEDMLRRNHINAENAYGRPLKATAEAIKGLTADSSAGPAPAGVDAQLWSHMTPQERSLWQQIPAR